MKYMRKIAAFLLVILSLSCHKDEKTSPYAEFYYDFSPGALTPMQIYCKCIPINDTTVKHFQHTFYIKGDSLKEFCRLYRKLKPSDKKDAINARVHILLHNKDKSTDTICIGYSKGIQRNGIVMTDNLKFTSYVEQLVAAAHWKKIQKSLKHSNKAK